MILRYFLSLSFVAFFVDETLIAQTGRPEMVLKIVDGDGEPIEATVELYTLEDVSEPLMSGQSHSTYGGKICDDYNFQNSINDADGGDFGESIWTNETGNWYYLKIGSKFVLIMIPDTPNPPGNAGDFHFTFQNNDFTLLPHCNQRGIFWNQHTGDWNAYFNVVARNSFGGGGKVAFPFGHEDPDSADTPASGIVLKQPSSVTLYAVDRQYIQESGEQWYYRIYQDWRNTVTGEVMASAPQLSFMTDVAEDVSYTANFNKEFNIEVLPASYIEPGGGGTYNITRANPPLNISNVSSWEGTHVENIYSPVTVEAAGEGWILHQWSDGNTDNPRILTPTDHTGLSATYKAHLGSTLADATSSNSQRKLVKDGSLPSHLGYSSAGEIWVVQSSGESWLPEVRVSNGSGGFSTPSLATLGLVALNPEIERDVYITYRKLPGSNYSIHFSEKVGGSWQNPVQINTNAISSPVDSRPVIARTNTEWPGPPSGDWSRPTLVTVWEGSDGLRSKVVWPSSSGGWNWSSQAELSLTSAGYHNPSLSSAYLDFQTQPYLYLTYDNTDDVFIRPHSGYWIESEETVPASISPSSYGSQVSAETRDPEVHQIHIVWEALNPDIDQGTSVMYQGFIAGKWSAAHEFVKPEGGDYRSPSITYLEDGTLLMVWDDVSSTYQARKPGLDDSEWTIEAVYDAATKPNLVQGGTSGALSSARFVSTSTSGPPYAVQVSDEFGMDPTFLPLEQKYSRRVVAARLPSRIHLDTSAYCAIELTGIQLKLNDGTPVPLTFRPVQTTLPGFNENTAWSHLATEPVTLASTVDSIVIYGKAYVRTLLGLIELEELGLRLNFELRDARDSTVIRRVGTERLFLSDTVSQLVTRERLSGLAGREVFIRPTLTGIARNKGNIVYTLVHVHTVLGDTASRPVDPLPKQPVLQSLAPTTFALQQNYPNPFNPSTVIRYQLPVESYVSLKVYDLLGRQVATLVSEAKAAGYYEAVFDASSLGSGVYVYRMQAGEYHAVRKLVVVK